MKWTTFELIKQKNINNKFQFICDFSKLVEQNEDIYRISEVTVSGSFSVYDDEEFVFDLSITGQMVLACAITLKEVEYPIQLNVTEVFSKTENEDNNIINGITIDLFPIVWSNILLDKPMRVISDGAYEDFDNEIVSFEEEEEEYVNPAFKDLAKFK